MLLALLVLCGCSSNKPEKTPEKPAPPQEVVPDRPTEPEPSVSGGKPYYVKVNCQTNTVTIYTQDERGFYTVPYMAMVCSSGLDAEGPDKATCIGEYTIGYTWEWLEMVNNVYGCYVTQFNGDYLFHSVPYLEQGNHGSLQPGEFDKLGQDASHGCIRLQVKDAKWIYDHALEIEGVQTFNSSEPGPLGKPDAPKIGSSEYPGWDPTDPDEANPWRQ